MNTIMAELLACLRAVPPAVALPFLMVERFNPVTQAVPADKRPACFPVRGSDTPEQDDADQELHMTRIGVLILPETTGPNAADVDKRLVELESLIYQRVMDTKFTSVGFVNWGGTTPSTAHAGLPQGSSVITFRFYWAHPAGDPYS